MNEFESAVIAWQEAQGEADKAAQNWELVRAQAMLDGVPGAKEGGPEYLRKAEATLRAAGLQATMKEKENAAQAARWRVEMLLAKAGWRGEVER